MCVVGGVCVVCVCVEGGVCVLCLCVATTFMGFVSTT